MSFSYRLVVLTHGDSAPLPDTINSFAAMVLPWPTSTVVVYDGQDNPDSPTALREIERVTRDRLSVRLTNSHVGFCAATELAWNAASEDGPDWIFWLEHDFTFNRPVDLSALAAVMDAEPQVTQMALLRQPVSDAEVEIGGYLNTPHRDYQPRETAIYHLGADPADDFDIADWFEHRDYWTTNPSLFRRQLAVDLAWPTSPQCEGHFGFAVRAAIPGASFGVWGDGAEWVTHTGVRDGKGY